MSTASGSAYALYLRALTPGQFGMSFALLGQMIRAAVIALLATGACAAPIDNTAPDEEQSDLVEVIDYRLPAAPTEIEFDAQGAARASQSVSYGHCLPAETDEDGAITINCPEKWSEVAWFRISNEDVQARLASGENTLDVALQILSTPIPDSLRFSVHEVAADGSKTKILSEANFFDGDTERFGLESDASYEFYVAGGHNTVLQWGNGTIEFSLDVTPL